MSGLKVTPARVASNGKVAVANTTTVVLAANASRVDATIVNDSDEAIYLARGEAAVLNEGIRINAAGGVYNIDATNLWRGTVNAISTSGSKNITVTEGAL